MALENITTNANLSEVFYSLANSINVTEIPGVSSLIKIGQVAGVLILVYIIFLIIRGILQIKYSFRIKSMAKNLKEINQKMDILVKAKIFEKENKKSLKEKKENVKIKSFLTRFFGLFRKEDKIVIKKNKK